MLPDTGLLFWMVVIFAIVFVILAKFGFPVITSMIDKRRDYIDNSLKLAQETDRKMAEMQAEYDRLIEQAHVEQHKILEEAAEARKAMIEHAKSEAQEEADKLMADAKVRIEAETESALRDIRRQIAVLSVEVAEKVIRKDMSSDQAQIDFVNKMLDEMQTMENHDTAN